MADTLGKSQSFPATAWYYLRLWVRAGRPFTLTAAVVPVLVGSALAVRDGVASALLFILILAGSLLVQIAANLVDEYSDHARPEGKEKHLAPYKVIALGLLSHRAVKLGAIVCLAVATGIGIYLVAVSGWPLLVLCLASIAAAYFYSGGPKPLGAYGVGQPLVFVFMGPVMVLGTYYVFARTFPLDALWLSLPVGLNITNILVANDLRDREEDVAARKMTPVATFGERFGRWEWTGLLAAAYAVVIVLAVTTYGPWLLLPLAALPWAVQTRRFVWRGGDRAQRALALRASARLNGYFGVLLAAGMALAHLAVLHPATDQ
jgi:1,4-dihydroxy-2-naphthoate octaprenyltransferase